MNDRPRSVAAVLLTVAVLVVTPVAGSGVAFAQEASGGADEVYVTEEGDAVLVFQGEERTSDATAEYGLTVDEGLAYLLVENPDAGDGSVTAGFSAAITQAAMTASGNLTAPKPEGLESLSVNLEAVTNEQESRFDATFSSTLSSAGGLGMVLQRASTDGAISMGADRLQAKGNFEVASRMGMSGPQTSMSVSLREQDGTYTVEISQDRVVSEFAAEQWRTREVARETVERQFGMVAMGLGGQSSVSIDSYSFSETGDGRYRLDITYTATLSGVEGRLEQVLATQLARTGELSQAQAEKLAADLRAVTINEASFSFETGGGTVSGSFALDVGNYGDLLLTYFDVAEDLGASGTTLQSLERARKTYEAQRAAGLTYELSWSGSIEAGQQTTIDAELHQGTTNWQAYVDKLQARDVPVFATRYALAAETRGDRLRLTGSATYEGDRIVTRFVNQVLNASDVPERSATVLRGFKRADLEKAKVAATLDERLRIEAGAKFGNMAVLRQALAGMPQVPVFDSVVGRTEGGATTTYVRVSGAVSGDAGESDVRSLPAVGPDTTVHLPGTWDREFPTMDTQRAREFLELGEDIGVGTTTVSGGGPGFGPVVALVALLALALLAVRREH